MWFVACNEVGVGEEDRSGCWEEELGLYIRQGPVSERTGELPSCHRVYGSRMRGTGLAEKRKGRSG